MAISATTPVAPWTTGVGGSGTWDDIVTFINNAAVIQKISTNVYLIQGLIDITASVTALKNSVLISKSGGNWSVGSGGNVTFGASVVNASGQTLYVDGCSIIEETDAYARGADNYGNTKCWLRTGGTLNIYASDLFTRNTATSHLDFQSGATLKVRSSRFYHQATATSFDHYAGTVDIDGLTSTHASDTSGSLLELLATSTVTQLKGFVPYLNSSTARQCTLWISSVSLNNWGGDNFAPWYNQGYYRFPDPLTTSLKKVDNNGGATLSSVESRTVSLICLSGTTPIQAQVTAINNLGMSDFQVTASATGIATGLLKRTAFQGGASYAPLGVTRTPHIVYAKKWGYKTSSSIFSATPTSYAQTQLSGILPMILDSNITLTSSQASAITGVSIQCHGRPVLWNSKNFSTTITAQSGTSLSNIYHAVAYAASELVVHQPRKKAVFSNAGGQRYYMTWPGASGDTDLTFAIVHKSRPNAPVFGDQIAGSIGDGTVGLALRTLMYDGMVIQNYTTNVWANGTKVANQLQHVNPDGGEQLMITIGVYTASTGLIHLYSNNYDYGIGSAVSHITRGATSYFSIGSFSNGGSWAASYHSVCEQLGFDRALSAAEVTDLTYYLGKKWNFTGFGNIVPGVSTAYNPATYPVNGSGNDWTPLDYTVGTGPRCWIDMSSSSNYTLSGTNIVTFKDLVSGNNIINNSGNYSSASCVDEGVGWVLPQLLSEPTKTIGATYADGLFRGVRVIDENGNPFIGFTQMQSDDGTYYIPPVSASVTLTGVNLGSEVRIYKVSDDSELSGIESTISTTFTYSYQYTSDIPIYIVIFALTSQPIRLLTTLTSSNSTIPIQQTVDRVYENV